MKAQHESWGLMLLFVGAFLGIGGYPLFIYQRKNIGVIFGVCAGLAVSIIFRDRLPGNLGLIAIGVTALVFAVLFYSSLTLMNVGVSTMIGFAMAYELYAIVFRQAPNVIIPAVIAILCGAGAVFAGIPFVIGTLAFAGSFLVVAGIEFLLLPQLMVDSTASIVAFNLSPILNIVFIVVCLALSVGSFFLQYYVLQQVIRRR